MTLTRNHILPQPKIPYTSTTPVTAIARQNSKNCRLPSDSRSLIKNTRTYNAIITIKGTESFILKKAYHGERTIPGPWDITLEIMPGQVTRAIIPPASPTSAAINGTVLNRLDIIIIITRLTLTGIPTISCDMPVANPSKKRQRVGSKPLLTCLSPNSTVTIIMANQEENT